ncbi:MAG: NAD(P)-dependent glycerol-3-phosphate dehydrogenase [Nitrospiraceae bacterium]|nr:MAG: NAD(P)-dependent glycerol-3-phosphate dehydrogenase [Nitrospiraceae bacterium]
MSYIAVIGAGSWGTTLACILSEKGYDISLWVYEESLAEEIRNTRINSTYLPDITIPDNIRITHKLNEAVKQARYVVSVIPTQYTRAVFEKADFYIPDEAVIISASKGIERGTLLTVSSIFKEITGHKIAVLSGPSFAKEAIMKKPTVVTLATEDTGTGLLLQEILNTNHFRVYTNNDLIGVELGGALKNVMAIASGISDGLGLGNNARAAMITRGLAEMRRLGLAMGAREETFSGLSGLGDLVLTCTSVASRNYTTGIKLAQGVRLDDILSQTKAVAEGVDTTESAYHLSKKYNVEMPIVEQIYKVLYEDKNPAEAVNDLMNRALKSEF